ncbi:MAG: hypothetical protein ACI8V5_003615, partial [Limisphaerales bacterium]
MPKQSNPAVERATVKYVLAGLTPFLTPFQSGLIDSNSSRASSLRDLSHQRNSLSVVEFLKPGTAL